MIKRMMGIAFIFVCVTFAWLILATTVQFRTDAQDRKLRESVGQLWGAPQKQQAPCVWYETIEDAPLQESVSENDGAKPRPPSVRHDVPLEASAVTADLSLDYRRKGLLWYSTYHVRFEGNYTVNNPTSDPRALTFCFVLPSKDALYDDFRVTVGGVSAEAPAISQGQVRRAITLAPGQSCSVRVGYTSQGMDEWRYAFGETVTQVKNFSLKVRTDFDGFDFPIEAVSPTSRNREGEKNVLTWNYASLLSGVQIGVALPKKLNPGPWVSEVTYAAPVSLFLFFFLVFIISTRRGVSIHPMNYFFVGAAYFSFHLLMAYLVDHVSLAAAFALASAVSVGLVVSYMRVVCGPRFAFFEVGLSQLIYQVLFSATFFLTAFTGLSITVLCVLTLFVVMQYTARVNWEEVFKGKPSM